MYLHIQVAMVLIQVSMCLQSLSSALAQNSGGQRPLARAGSSATLYNPLTRTPSNLWGAQQLQNQVALPTPCSCVQSQH